ncbi:MAG TPA: hypothetical protein VJ867_01795 [Gemmatimonadaceae bacterium]|nr:hypothetical protein [Gemmatimonadaceae bacterium]
MRRVRSAGDVASLPKHAFGAAAVTWWAMWGLMLIEGITMVLVSASYIYIRQNFHEWPPAHTPLPSLGWPIVNLANMWLSVVPAVWAFRAARRHDTAAIRTALWIQSAMGVLAMVLRYVELQSLNVRWDTNAYGSVAWAVLVTHGVVMVTDVMDSIGLALLFTIEEPEEKHFVDTCENSQFWYFIVASWTLLFVLAYLYPRWTS